MVLIDFGFGGIKIAASAAGTSRLLSRVLALAARMQVAAGQLRIAPQRRNALAGHTRRFVIHVRVK
jgi:hypothetical protein